MVRSRKSAAGVVPRKSKLAVLAFWKFLAAKAQIFPPDNSLFLSPSHAHPLLGFKSPFQPQWYVCIPIHCIQHIEALFRAILPLESICLPVATSAFFHPRSQPPYTLSPPAQQTDSGLNSLSSATSRALLPSWTVSSSSASSPRPRPPLASSCPRAASRSRTRPRSSLLALVS